MLLLVSKLPAKSIYHSSVPLAPTRIKKKNPALGAEKTVLAASTLTGTITGTGTTLSLVPCHFVLRMVFVKLSVVFFRLFCLKKLQNILLLPYLLVPLHRKGVRTSVF